MKKLNILLALMVGPFGVSGTHQPGAGLSAAELG